MIYNDEIINKIGEVEKFWGEKMPMKAMEEAGELIQAISKVETTDDLDKRESYINYNLMAEMRDMYISLMALHYRYNISCEQMRQLIEMKLDKKY